MLLKNNQAERGGVTLDLNDPEDRRLAIEAMKLELAACRCRSICNEIGMMIHLN